MGDTSFRIIPSNINANNLEEHHRSNSFDHFGIKTNPFSALTIPHLLDLSNEGFIKIINNRNISLMGSIINPSNLIKESIPKIINILKMDNVDIVILIPI